MRERDRERGRERQRERERETERDGERDRERDSNILRNVLSKYHQKYKTNLNYIKKQKVPSGYQMVSLDVTSLNVTTAERRLPTETV